MTRLLEKYRQDVVPVLKQELGEPNALALPRIMKITVNMGVGKATENKNRMEAAVKDLTVITGQKPLITKARKSVAGFKLREGQEIGAKVTLRGKRMYEFLDRLVSLAIPRIRDFRGLSPKAFDKGGNYTLGIAEQAVFPEINLDQTEFVQGMDITMTIQNGSPEKSLVLLTHLGMPFRKAQ